MPSLRQLRYFAAVADRLHFGRAAEACAVSQPALSMQIRELEAELGLTLVDRGKSGVVLTAEGAEVAERARAVLAQVKDLEDFARARTGMEDGQLALGVIPSIAPYLLPSLLPRLRARFPRLELKLREATTDIVLADLRAGELDAVIAALPLAGDDLEVMALFDDPFLLAAGREEPGLADLDLARLPRERLLLLEEGHCLRDQALSYCGLGDVSAFGATSLTTLMQMVAAGYGVTLLPQMAARELSDARIVLTRPPAPGPKRTVGLAWRASSPRRRPLRSLGDLVREAASA